MTAWRQPKMRDGLRIVVENNVARAVDTTNGKSTQCHPVDAVVLHYLDGSVDEAEMIGRVQFRGIQLTSDDLALVLERLRAHGLLDPRAPRSFSKLPTIEAEIETEDGETFVDEGFFFGDDDDDGEEIIDVAALEEREDPTVVALARRQPQGIVEPGADGWDNERRRMFNAALVLYKQGLVVEAGRYLAALLELDPHNPEALTLAAILDQEKQRRGAMSLQDMQAELVRELDREETRLLRESNEDEYDEEDDDEEEDDEEDEDDGPPLPSNAFGPPKRRLRKWAIRLAVLSVITGLAYVIQWPLTAKHDCLLFAAKRRVARSAIDGLVRTVHVHSGQWVKAGTLVMKLDDSQIDSSLEKVRARIAQVNAELRILKRGATRQERLRARQAVAAKAVAVAIKRRDCRRIRKLVRQGVIPRDKLVNCRSALTQLSAALNEERARMLVTMRHATPAEIAQVQAKRDQFVAQKRLLERQLKDTVLRAPISGIVVTPKLSEKVGVRLNRGDEAFEIADDRVITLEIKVAQENIDILKLGLPVALKVPNMPEQTFMGKVTAIDAKVRQDSADTDRYVIVRSVIENPKRELRYGISGVAEIRAGKRSLLYHGARRIIRAIRVSCVL